MVLFSWNIIFLTPGQKSKSEVGLPHATSVLFQYDVLPGDKINDLQSNEIYNDIGKTWNSGKNGFDRYLRFHKYWFIADPILNRFI